MEIIWSQKQGERVYFTVSDIDEEKYISKRIQKRILALNKYKNDVSNTYKREGAGKDIEENKIEIQAYLQNQMKLALKAKHLNDEEFLKVKNFLISKHMVLQKFLNFGGEADVYLGWKINERSEKEEKVFRIIKAKSNEQILKITKEYDNVKTIFKPQNLIQYDEILTIDNIIIFIMKKYSGSLKDKMSDKFTNHQFLKVALNLFEGLIELRVNNIIHSDIKPANILIDQIDEDFKCFYSDFGMCMKLNQKQELSSDTEGYTPKYCSPEQITNQLLTFASDMYSLGLVLLEMSEKLLDVLFKDTIQSFLWKYLVLKNPQERISVEELIPQFVVATALNNDKEIIEEQITKIQNSFKLDELEFKVNTSKNLKVILSNKLVLIMLNYLLMNQSQGITYQSLYENKFEGLNTFNIANLFYEIACLPGNTLSNEKIESNDNIKNKNKKKYLKDSLEVLEQIPPSHQRDELLAKVLFYLGQLFLIEENFNEALENLSKAFELSINDIFPQYLKYRIMLFLGKTHFYLKDQDSATMFFESFEEIFAEEQSDKYQEITDQYLFAQTLEECGNNELSLKYYERITNYWDTNFGDYLNNVTNDQQCNALKVVSQSYFKQKKYDEFLYVQIQYLKVLFQSEEGLYHFEIEVYKFQFILMQSDLEVVNNQFDVMNDVYKEEPLFNKMILVPFIVAFSFQQNFERMREAQIKFNSIEQEIPFESQLQIDLVTAVQQGTKENNNSGNLKLVSHISQMNEMIKQQYKTHENGEKIINNVEGLISLSNSWFTQPGDIETVQQKFQELFVHLENLCQLVLPQVQKSSESEGFKSLTSDLSSLVTQIKSKSLTNLQMEDVFLLDMKTRFYEAVFQNTNNKLSQDSTFQQKEFDQNAKRGEDDQLKENDENSKKDQINKDNKFINI